MNGNMKSKRMENTRKREKKKLNLFGCLVHVYVRAIGVNLDDMWYYLILEHAQNGGTFPHSIQFVGLNMFIFFALKLKIKVYMSASNGH